MLNETSLAAAVGASIRNVQFASEALNLPRKILIIGTHDPAKLAVAPHVPQLILSPEDAGDRYGFGSMIHRLAVQAFRGSFGVETWVQPQAEAAGAAAAVGHIDFTGSAAVKAGTLYIFISNVLVAVNVAAAATPAQIATATVAACAANTSLPVSAAVDGAVAGKVNFTGKSKGTFGNFITLALNLGAGQVTPSGITAVITAMADGAGIPDIAAALTGLGTGDSANEAYFTDVIHGYGQDTATMDAILAYVGAGNDASGLYGKTVSRPFRVLVGDTVAGSQGLSDLLTLTGLRKTDRAQGVIAVPGSYSHPAEIAAQAMGIMARINQDRVAQHYLGIALIGIHPGSKSARWTSDYDNRDTAVKNGVSPTRVQAGVVYLQNMCTFYRPDNVPASSNGYRSMRNISIIQNMLFNVRLNFEQEKWQGISIVADVTRVSSMVDRDKARDIDSVIDDLVALAISFESKAWIYEAAFTIGKLKQAGAVSIRTGGLGFNSVLAVIFSGEGGILDNVVEFDTSLAVLLNQ